MAKKKQIESVATGSTRVLRPRTPTTGEEKVEENAKGKVPVKVNEKAKGKMPVRVDEKPKGKMPVKVNEKAEGKKTVASGKLKIGDSGESVTAGKRKVVAHEGNKEAAGSRVKKVRASNKSEMNKGGASGSTRVLRSNSAKKGDEAGNEVVKKLPAKAKTHKETVEANMLSSGKGSCSLVVDFTRPGSAIEKAARSSTKGQVALQKNPKGKKILKRKEAEEEAESDEDMKKEAPLTIGSPRPKKNLPVKKEVPLNIRIPKPKKNLPVKKEAPLTIGSPKPKENLPVEPSKRATRKGGKSKDAVSQEHTEDITAVASSSKTAPKQVSNAEKKRGGVQASTPIRRNPARKGRADAKTNK